MEVECSMLAIVKHCEPQTAGKHGPSFGEKSSLVEATTERTGPEGRQAPDL